MYHIFDYLAGQLRKYGWVFITTIMLGITAVFLPLLYHRSVDVARAGAGTPEDPYTVCAGVCDYTSIQTALNNTPAGSYVAVGATYESTADGGINIENSNITLDCQDSGAVIGDGTTYRELRVAADNFTLKDCNLRWVYIADRNSLGQSVGVAGLTVQDNIFVTSTEYISAFTFAVATTTNPVITNNVGNFKIVTPVYGMAGMTVSSNTFTLYKGNESAIELIGPGGDTDYIITGNTFSDYSGTDNRFVKNTILSAAVSNVSITNNNLSYVINPTTNNQGGVNIIQIQSGTSDITISGNYITLPSAVVAGSSPRAIDLGEFDGSATLAGITINNNTIVGSINSSYIAIENISGTPDVNIQYNLFYNTNASATSTGFVCSNTITTSSLIFDYNGFYNLSNNITPYSPCISTIGANSKTNNPYLKIDDVDSSNDMHLAPFSDYLDVNGTTDIGAYSTARGNSFTINPSGTIDYSSVHATTTDMLAIARNSDTFTLAAGTYNPISFSSLSSITLDGAGATTIINGGTTSSSLLLTNVNNSTFQDFVIQNASSTIPTYTATNMIFDYGGDTYGDTTILGSPADNYTEMFSGATGCDMDVEWNVDGYDVTDYVSDDWHLWLFSALGGKFTVLVPDQFYASAAAVEAACPEASPTTDVWIDNVFQYSGGIMTYNSSAVAAAGVTLTSGMTNPPAITRTLSGYAGIKFAGTSSGNTVSNVTSSLNGYGIWFSGTSGTNNVNDSLLQNSVLYDLYSDTSGTNNIKNTSFTIASTTASGGGQMNVYEKFRAYVIDETNVGIAGAAVNATSTDGSVTAAFTTEADGYTSYTDYLLAFILNDDSPLTTQGGINPFSFRAVKAGYDTKIQSTVVNSANQTVTVQMNDNPNDPTGVVATSTAPTSIVVQWTDNSFSESNFIFDYIEGISDTGFPGMTSSISAFTGIGVVTTTIDSLTPNTGYMARVQAVGEGGSSNYVTSSVMYTDPNVPTTVIVTPNGQKSVIVSWNANDNPNDTVYELYNVTSNASVTSSTTSTSHIVTGLSTNTSYTFEVRAQYMSSTTQWSSYSSTATASTAQVSASVAVTMNVGQSVGFELTTAGSHTGTLNSISNGTASLTVASTPVTVSLTQGNTTYIDSNGNGINDMSIAATQVGSNSATFTFADYTPPGGGSGTPVDPDPVDPDPVDPDPVDPDPVDPDPGSTPDGSDSGDNSSSQGGGGGFSEFIEQIKSEHVIEAIEVTTIFVKETAQEVVSAISDSARVVGRIAQQFVDNPKVEKTNEQVATPIVATAAVANVATAGFGMAQVVAFARSFFGQFFLVFRRRKQKKWGVVYNGFTKHPIDLATVRLLDAKTGTVIRSQVTDMQGRYFFAAPVGEYRIEIAKEGFEGFCEHLRNVEEDSRYTHLYHGETIRVEEEGQQVNFNVPIEPAGTTKTTTKIIRDKAKMTIRFVVSIMGLIASIVSFIISPAWWIALLIVLHIFFYLLFYRIGYKKLPDTFGKILSHMTQKPLGKVVIRVFDATYNKLVDTVVSDRKGRYAVLLGPSTYYATYEKPSYEPKKSPTIDFSSARTQGLGGILTRDEVLSPDESKHLDKEEELDKDTAEDQDI